MGDTRRNMLYQHYYCIKLVPPLTINNDQLR